MYTNKVKNLQNLSDKCLVVVTASIRRAQKTILFDRKNLLSVSNSHCKYTSINDGGKLVMTNCVHHFGGIMWTGEIGGS